MVPRNLSFEELCDDKIVEIIKLKLNLRTAKVKKSDLYEQREFLEEQTLKFVDKIVQIRERDRLLPLQINVEISEFQNEVMRMEEKIDKLTYHIQNWQNRISILVRQLEQKQDEYRQFRVGNGRRPD